MACNHKETSACPFSFTDQSEYVQNLGCLPSPYEIKIMRVYHGKTWACHEEPTKPCAGAVAYLKAHKLPYKVEDPELVTESSPWHLYTKVPDGTTPNFDSRRD